MTSTSRLFFPALLFSLIVLFSCNSRREGRPRLLIFSKTSTPPDLQPLLSQCSPATLRQLARLRQLGVIKRVTGTYPYYLTALAAPLLLLAAASPNKPLFLLSLDNLFTRCKH